MKWKLKRWVADKNILRDGSAARWLANSAKHQLIITDFLLIECMQGDSLRNLSSDFSTLVPYAEQILLLKRSPEMSGQRPRSAGHQKRWINVGLTEVFRQRLTQGRDRFAHLMMGDPAFIEFAANSKAFLDEVSTNALEYRGMLMEIISSWPASVKKEFLNTGALSQQFAFAIFETARDTAAKLFHDRPRHSLPLFRAAIYSFEYRYALSVVLLAVEWTKGGVLTVAPDKLRNDLMDMTYVAFATLFDGLMTKEKKVQRIYAQARFFVEVARLVLEKEALLGR